MQCALFIDMSKQNPSNIWFEMLEIESMEKKTPSNGIRNWKQNIQIIHLFRNQKLKNESLK